MDYPWSESLMSEVLGFYSRCVPLQTAPLNSHKVGFLFLVFLRSLSLFKSMFRLRLLNFSAMRPRGRFPNAGGCRTSFSRLSQNKLAETSDLTFSPPSRQMLFSLLRKEWHFVSPRAQTFIVIALQFLILLLLAPVGLEVAAVLSLGESRFAESLWNLWPLPKMDWSMFLDFLCAVQILLAS